MIFFNTIPQGERYALWQRDGCYRLIDGPRRVFAPLQRSERLAPVVALPDQYLVVRHKDGRAEHIPGPVVEWIDPVTHHSIDVKAAIPLEANEAIVSYCEVDGEITRQVIRGPDLHFPAADEWIHEFSWHGSGARGEGHKKRPHGLTFSKLRTMPDQMYFDVPEVRTADEALLTIRAMMFFELIDIEEMLDQTHDPIADLINSLTADVIGFAAGRSFETFKTESGELNSLDAYPPLVARSQRIGYRLNKVVYRDYHASDQLQAMHDNAIETRTRLVLEAETEEQEQDLEDLKLGRSHEREQACRVEETATAEHRHELERTAHDALLAQQQKRAVQDIEVFTQRGEAEQRLKEEDREGRLGYLRELRGLDADLTAILVAENRNPDRHIRVDGDGTTNVLLGEAAA